MSLGVWPERRRLATKVLDMAGQRAQHEGEAQVVPGARSLFAPNQRSAGRASRQPTRGAAASHDNRVQAGQVPRSQELSYAWWGRPILLNE